MDINGFILERSFTETTDKYNFSSGNAWVNQINFDMIHAIDKKNIHIPTWFKELRVRKIFEYLIQIKVLNKNQVKYNFKMADAHPGGEHDFQSALRFNNLTIEDVNLQKLMLLSRVIPSGDILEYMTFKPSEGYGDKTNKDLTMYKLHGSINP